MTLEEMKAMELNDIVQLKNRMWVQRVPNGWIYSPPNDFNQHRSGVFVPEVLLIQIQKDKNVYKEKS